MEKCDCEWNDFVNKQYEEEKEPLSSDAVLGDGWRDTRKELPPRGAYCLTFTDCGNYINQIYKDFWETEYPVNEERVIAWQILSPPAFA